MPSAPLPSPPFSKTSFSKTSDSPAAIVNPAGVLAAVFLACLGVYGLVAYRSGRRTHEIGIRVALGADNKDVLRLLLRQGVVPAGIGVTIGLALSYGVRRILGSVLYQPSGYAELTLAAATLFIAAVLFASYLPARRAASLEPMRALRQD
jgi:ABC-type antimicrobial peptide transport system permease subunit